VGAFLRDTSALTGWLERRNSDVLAAGARVSQARADLGSAKILLPNPTVDASLGGITVGPIHPPTLDRSKTLFFTVGLSQTIEIGKRGPRIEAASLRLDAAAKSQQATLASRVADARYAMGQVVYFKARLALLEDTLSSMKQSADLYRVQMEQGALSGSDYDRLVLDNLRLETEIAKGRAEYTAALAACQAAVFAPCTTEDAQISDIDAAAPLPPTLESSLAGRPDIAAARLEGEASQRDAVLARRSAIPDPSLRLEYMRDQNLFTNSQPNILSIGVSIPLPIFNRGQYDAARAEGRAAEQRQVVRAMMTSAAAEEGALRSRFTQLDGALRTLGPETITKSEGVIEAMSKAFSHGQVGLTDLLLARRTHLSLLLNQIDLRFALFEVRNDLRRVLGIDAPHSREVTR